MWILVAILLVPMPGKPDTEILKIVATKEACEAYKAGTLEALIDLYKIPYPLTFELECREVRP